MHNVEVVRDDSDHWRWICSCGRKGIRLIYRESVERLGREHIKKEERLMPKNKKKLNAYGETTGKKKKRLFLAEEVCYGICVGAQLGFSDREILEWVFEDVQKWSKYTLPKESKNV